MPDYIIRTSIKTPEVSAVKATTTERFVRAKNEARAVAHVVKDTLTVKRADIDDAIRLSLLGIKIEIAE